MGVTLLDLGGVEASLLRAHVVEGGDDVHGVLVEDVPSGLLLEGEAVQELEGRLLGVLLDQDRPRDSGERGYFRLSLSKSETWLWLKVRYLLEE